MKSILFALAVSTSVPALASDARIVNRFYDDTRVVRFEGRTNLQSTIAFEEGERIENIAIGDSARWQVTPNKRANLLFIKPVTALARTNMTVVTDRRTYLFELVASPRAPSTYLLRFHYPAPPPPPPPPQPVEEKPALTAAVLETAASPAPLKLNFAWGAKGDKTLMPERSFDDGASLYLSWPRERAVPAVLTIGPDGSEGPTNFAVRGDYIVVEGVPSSVVLRSGRAALTLSPSRPKPAASSQPGTQIAER
ncbi:TrbG/VirB9 family P-type conjugative transfer protein [Sphingomonas carotinifaciens]|uniref:Type IV secretion system protein VirB9 n=1 Tax=Sphingomonas carotinifaciens TaxID=1166323 RepID=A0A1G7M167_9SPHN|nr:TrbG/VirB9 family P-type conjugative transfer protein [Sphingomonas carotinifaciens]MBB4086956.1 type IV secretion system protein VirB9 [Sphingomonas carotinifaciens]MWC42150.1 type VI secretion protein [Sphingomonas carotinifaciens]SDF55542.1 type IV secretion system protein VirB9 [Sphingomonas carotinifaciens]